MRFYVYELIDPRDLAVFYVGKGQGSRVREHVRDARLGRVSNRRKHERITAILAAGLEPIEAIVARFEDEEEALSHEETLIASHHGALTNIMPRGAPATSASTIAQRIIALARADIAAARSADLVAFGREMLETGLAILAKAEQLRCRPA
jgi:hypothetical protein